MLRPSFSRGSIRPAVLAGLATLALAACAPAPSQRTSTQSSGARAQAAPAHQRGALPASFAAALVKRTLPTGARKSPFADEAGRIPFLVELAPGEDARALGLREIAPGIGAARFSPERFLAFAAANPSRGLSISPGTHTSLEYARKSDGVPQYLQATDGTGTGAGTIVGVVDTGIDITHPAFLDADGHSRIAWLLTWGPPRGLHPEMEDELGCNDPDQAPCSVLSGEDLDDMLSSTLPPAEDARDYVGHGTHVASIAAGNGQRGNGKQPLNVGVAPEATLVVVAPSPTGSFGDDQVIRGVKFVFDRAGELGMPAAVNLSLGGDFGPHDGTSLLERGVAAFVGDDLPGRVVVAAAGNSGGLSNFSGTLVGIHTEAHVDEHAPVKVPIYVPNASGGDVFVWVTFREDDEVSVGLDGPGGTAWIRDVPPGDESGYDDGSSTAAVVNNLVNEHSSLTEDTNGAVIQFSGAWDLDSTFKIRLTGHGDAQLWVVGQGAAIQGAYFENGVREGTINQPGSHPRLLAVGCTINRFTWQSLDGAIELEDYGDEDGPQRDSPCFFSASGPTPNGFPKPELVAPGAFIAAAMSDDADPRKVDGSMFDGIGCPNDTQCYIVDDRYAIASGTSMAAPQVTGAAALMLARDPTLTQARLTEILQASARNLDAPVLHTAMIGAGALDVRHALDVLETETTSNQPPDLAESYWYLSSDHARPEAAWHVHGIVQLRRADGEIASGLDGSLLTIEVENGALVEGPTKALHGTFDFAVAAREGTGQTSMTVRVLYDGAPIGEPVTLPIGMDVFAPNEEPSARGGLDCAAAPGAPRDRAVFFGLVALSALALARTRRARP
ncbi:MAG: S8 family serine peptidase [Polyangiaceae bacterium]